MIFSIKPRITTKLQVTLLMLLSTFTFDSANAQNEVEAFDTTEGYCWAWVRCGDHIFMKMVNQEYALTTGRYQQASTNGVYHLRRDYSFPSRRRDFFKNFSSLNPYKSDKSQRVYLPVFSGRGSNPGRPVTLYLKSFGASVYKKTDLKGKPKWIRYTMDDIENRRLSYALVMSKPYDDKDRVLGLAPGSRTASVFIPNTSPGPWSNSETLQGGLLPPEFIVQHHIPGFYAVLNGVASPPAPPPVALPRPPVLANPQFAAAQQDPLLGLFSGPEWGTIDEGVIHAAGAALDNHVFNEAALEQALAIPPPQPPVLDPPGLTDAQFHEAMQFFFGDGSGP